MHPRILWAPHFFDLSTCWLKMAVCKDDCSLKQDLKTYEIRNNQRKELSDVIKAKYPMHSLGTSVKILTIDSNAFFPLSLFGAPTLPLALTPSRPISFTTAYTMSLWIFNVWFNLVLSCVSHGNQEAFLGFPSLS